MLFFDKNNYFHSPSQVTDVIRQLRQDSIEEIETSAKKLACESFHDFARKHGDGLSALFPGTGIGVANTNMALMTYHWSRFLANGKIVYKIRPSMVDRLANITLSIPGKMLVPPHGSFLVSMPFGSLKTKHGSIVNIYVSKDEYNPSILNEDWYSTDDGVKDLLSNRTVSHILRLYAVSYGNLNEKEGKTFYCQFPMVLDMDVQEQFDFMMSKITFEHKDVIKATFNFVLNFCAYLSTKDPDICKILGIKYESKSSNPKKARRAAENNRMYGYDYTDVGRIYDTRYKSDTISYQETGKLLLRRFKVRSHIRAQWYGPKDSQHQELILIEEYEKGDNLETLNPRTVIVGS